MMNIKTILESRGLKIGQRKSRNDYLILCPFHDDKNESCSVEREKGFFKCWSCGEKGSIAKLIAKLDGVTEKEAWSILHGKGEGKTVRIKTKEERTPLKKQDKLTEKYYEVRDLMQLLISRKDLRLGKELNQHLKDCDTWNKFRERQKHLKEEFNFEDSVKEAKFEYIVFYTECYFKDKLYSEFTKLLKEYKFEKEFQLALELSESEKYKNYKLEKEILKKLNFEMFLKIKPKFDKIVDQIFQ